MDHGDGVSGPLSKKRKGVWMMIGEVCLLTNNVRKLADFYKMLLGIDNNSNDDTH